MAIQTNVTSTRHASAVAVGVWMLLALAASLAGMAREWWLRPVIGELRAHQAGTLLVCALFLAIIAVFVVRTKLSVRQALLIGISWLVGAVVFEFGVGHWVDHLSWSRLLADYDLLHGRLLLLVWITVAFAPAVIASRESRLHRRSHDRT